MLICKDLEFRAFKDQSGELLTAHGLPWKYQVGSRVYKNLLVKEKHYKEYFQHYVKDISFPIWVESLQKEYWYCGYALCPNSYFYNIDLWYHKID